MTLCGRIGLNPLYLLTVISDFSRVLNKDSLAHPPFPTYHSSIQFQNRGSLMGKETKDTGIHAVTSALMVIGSQLKRNPQDLE